MNREDMDSGLEDTKEEEPMEHSLKPDVEKEYERFKELGGIIMQDAINDLRNGVSKKEVRKKLAEEIEKLNYKDSIMDAAWHDILESIKHKKQR